MGFLDRFFPKKEPTREPVYFYNTLTRQKKLFTLPAHARFVRMYNCGPTVYDRQHIGNLSMAVFADTLRRVLEADGYQVKQVINITDFGHLVSDGDEGEDKMAKGLKREGLKPSMENMRELATKYMDLYLQDIRSLNVETEKIKFPRASDYIPAQIAMVKTLEEKGYAYKTSDGVYFDTARFPGYGALGGIDASTLKEGARVAANLEKRAPGDFALWKFNTNMGWDSPWGKGFPGWHIECSAMIHALLGKQIDIHTGGIEHIAIHHNNEIAQSEAVTGKKPFSRFWMHRAHIQMEGAKLAKSTGNTAYLSDLAEHNILPLSLRYWFLTSHYRSPANFTWEALEAAQTAYLRLRRFMDTSSGESAAEAPPRWVLQIRDRLNDDLDTAGALAAVWEMSKDPELSRAQVRAGILEADKVLGLGFEKEDKAAKEKYDGIFGVKEKVEDAPEEVQLLLVQREEARSAKDWARADELRDKIAEQGYRIEDGAEGPRLVRAR